MGIEATTSSVSVTSTSSNTSTSNTSSKTNSDTSFKDEMTKVSTTEEKKESKEVSKESAKDTKSNETKEKKEVLGSEKSSEKKALTSNNNSDNQNQVIDGQITFNNQFAINNANMMLSNDIAQMVENSASLSSVNNNSWTLGFGSESKSNIKMNESDAQFFLNLTQDGDVSMQNIAAQGQNMLNSGADAAEVKQNVQVSQTLLNALNEARQNNQPIRIDFDQNIAVILRVGRDGAISAQFIPSDKVAEQYLRANIDELRASFDEQDLPYSDLSYSHSSKEQNKKRRQQAQQGE